MLKKFKDKAVEILQSVQKDDSPNAGNTAPDAEALALAALMFEAASQDDNVDRAERDTIRRLIGNAFEIEDEQLDGLLAAAESAQQDANQIVHFTRTLKNHIPFEDRARTMELMWEVVLADGEIHDHEANLMRRLAGLLHVTDQDSGRARKRAEHKFGLAQGRKNSLED